MCTIAHFAHGFSTLCTSILITIIFFYAIKIRDFDWPINDYIGLKFVLPAQSLLLLYSNTNYSNSTIENNNNNNIHV